MSPSAIICNNNSLQLQWIGRIRTKKERKHLEKRGYNIFIHRKEHGYENISLDSDGLGSQPVIVFRYDSVKPCVSMAESKLLSSDRLCMFCNL